MPDFLPVWVTGNLLDSAAVLMTAALGAFITFRMGLFNFGGEGQMYAGGLVSSAVILGAAPYVRGPVDGAVVLCAALAAAAGAGALLGGVCGFLKKRTGADELLTTFLLSASVAPLCDALIGGVFRDRGGNLLASAKFPAWLVLPKILPPSNLSVSFIIAPLCIVLFAVFLARTAAGYRFFVAGAAPEFARFGRIDPRQMIVPALAAGAALHGLAGFFLCAGSSGRLHLGFPGGMGWNAIAAALLAGKRPLLLIPVAVLFCAALAVSDNALLLYGLRLETKRFSEAGLLLLAASIRMPTAAMPTASRPTALGSLQAARKEGIAPGV